MTKTVTKENVFEEIDKIFENDILLGDYEDREKKMKDNDISLPLLQGLYPASSIIIYLERTHFKAGIKLNNFITDYFTENKEKLDTVELGIPNWSSAIQIFKKQYPKLTFYYVKGKDISETIEQYENEMLELASKLIKFATETNEELKNQRNKKK